MSRKGGYKILNMQDLFFDTSVSKTVPGIYDLVSALESKVTLISGLDIDDVLQDDMFVTWVNDEGVYKATIGDQTIAVASDDTVIITDGIIGGGGSGPTTVDAEDVTYDNSTSGLEAENVQDAIDELAGKEPPTPQIDAEDVDYDNTDSGLQATNVQAAIDEVAGRAEGIPKVNITANGTISDTATTWTSLTLSSIQKSVNLTEGEYLAYVDIKSGTTHYTGELILRQSRQSGYTNRYIGYGVLGSSEYSFGDGVLYLYLIIDPQYPGGKYKYEAF